MATSDKLNRVLQTKTDIKNAMNSKGMEVNDSTPFSEYSSIIEAVKIPNKTSDLTNDGSDGTNLYIDKNVNNLTNYTLTSSLSTVATSGNYNDLSNKPTFPSTDNFAPKNHTHDDRYYTESEINSKLTDYAKLSQVGLPVGFEYFTTKPTVRTGSLPLLGGEFSRTDYKDLWEWINSNSDYVITESYWQSLYSSNNGNVPFYSVGNGSTTFRVPSIKCYIKGNGSGESTGQYKKDGLPNITGYVRSAWITFNGTSSNYNGSLVLSNDKSISNTMEDCYNPAEGDEFNRIDFDASLSNSIYGNSNTVTPETLTGYWCVIAFGTITNTGSIDVSNLLNNYLPKSGGTINGNLTVTGEIIGNKVYNSGADYAECFDNTNLIYKDVLHRIVEVNNKEEVILSTGDNIRVIGVISDNYGHLMGGLESDIENGSKIPVGLAGTLYVDTKDELLEDNLGKFVIADKDGYCRKIEKKDKNKVETIVGKIIGFDFENNRYKVLLVLR